MATQKPSTVDALARQGGPRKAGEGVFDAIADPTRRAILDRLSRGALAAGEIASGFDMARPSVSKHLRVLREAGLVRVEERGRMRFYEMDSRPLQEIDRWLERHRTHLAARLVAIKRVAERGTKKGEES